MNPVNATALYVSASRAVLQCDPRQPHTFSDMYSLLPYFRQSLACLVCGKLLQDPISTTHPECEHYVCLACKGQKMRIRTSCNRCKDYSSFQENKQLSLLVQCYRKLCLFVTHSPLLQSISSQVDGSPEVLALLEEVLVSYGDEMETEDQEEAAEPESSAPTEPPSEHSAHAASSDQPCTNGPRDCNGEVLDDLDPSSPELEVCELVEEQTQRELSVPASGLEVDLAARPLAQAPVCSLRDGDSNSRGLEEGEVLLLSVEEVLQTLDPIQPSGDVAHLQLDRTHAHIALDKPHTEMFIQLDAAHNYSQVQKDRTHVVVGHGGLSNSSSLDPAASFSSSPPVRLNRKRSRSESDREKVVPLPIGSILNGPTPHVDTPNSSDMPHTPLPPSLNLPSHTFLSFSNGAPPKSNRAAVNHCKGPRKSVDPKKPHTKARSGAGAKSKERSKDPRLTPGCPVASPPVRPPYKKPVEKKGCKCGRATQNPSVLTCRGQRCPCYSNRKACLDCICRGCQNSYMANGEKKLEAFAVPEKALEQTRLTLGINLTSITAAAALRNPATTSIRTNTLLNVATATGTPVTTAFLTASPPQESNFEDSLELLIG